MTFPQRGEQAEQKVVGEATTSSSAQLAIIDSE